MLFTTFKLLSPKIYPTPISAVADIPSNSRLLIGGFGICGIPENLLVALSTLAGTISSLEIVSNNGGISDWGNGLLIKNGQIKRLTGSYVGENKILEQLYLSGALELNLIPQGTLAEKMRAGGAGIPAFYTPTGVDTMVEFGGFPIRVESDSGPALLSTPKQSAHFNGQKYLLEESIVGDFALVKAKICDRWGNARFNKTANNFNYDAATAGKVTILEVEEISETPIEPNNVHLPGIFVNRIVKAPSVSNKIERMRSGGSESTGSNNDGPKERIAARAALEVKSGDYLNLGIGIPNMVTDYLNVDATVQTENGMLGVGPYPYGAEDPDLVSALKEPVSEIDGCSYFKSSDSFGMIRGKHVDVTMLGALQVSAHGDLANWIIPGKLVKGMGGAMDLVGSKGSRVIVTMEHCAKGNAPKILKNCTLPLTGAGVVDLLITEKGVFEFVKSDGGLRVMVLKEIFDGCNLEEIRSTTDCDFVVADDLKII